MAMWKDKDKRTRRPDDLAPPLPEEPAFERPTDEAYGLRRRRDPFERSPSGSWADARTNDVAPAGDAPSFVDPGSFALANHTIPLMESRSSPAGAVGSASADLDSAPATDRAAAGPAPGGLAD